MQIKDQVRQFITKNFYVASETELADEESLLSRGIIDSTGVLEVIAFLEGTFGIQVEDQEMVPENLDSIGRISALVARKKG
ncbi:MAG: acyl carrier protein [Deltaproteobacteria bacterium]|nr:acyl carrier protein [Deltaproteobacteria bacterium]